MSDKEFEFRIPRGADVVTQGGRAQSPACPPRPRRADRRHAGVVRQQRRIAPRRAQRRVVAELRPRRRRIHQAAPRQPRQPRSAHGPRAREAARLAGSLHGARRLRPRASSKRRSSSTSWPRSSIPATRRSIVSCKRRGRSCAPSRRSRGRQDAARVADRAESAAPLPGADLPEDAKLPESVVFRDATPATSTPRSASSPTSAWCSIRPSAISRSRSICATRRSPRRSTLSAADAQLLALHRRPRTITSVPDTAAKRREYEEEVYRTFYLSNADLKETIDILRIVVDARRLRRSRRPTPSPFGHARAHHRRRQDHHRDRQGAAGSDHRRRAARGQSHAPARIRAADRVARLARHQRFRFSVPDPLSLRSLSNLTSADVLLTACPRSITGC